MVDTPSRRQPEPADSGALESKVLGWIDGHEADIVDFCSQFVRYESVLTDEVQVQDELIEPFLQAGGYTVVERLSADPEKERPNLWAAWEGSGGGPSVLFNGHSDVVPVFDHELEHRWHHPPFEPRVEDGNLIGRGSTDMKSGVTAYLWAVKALQECDVRLAGDVLVSVVVGEESGHPHLGVLPTTRAQIDRYGRPDLMIVAEPTHTEIHTISGGYFGFEVEIQGREVHVSERNFVMYPQRHGLPQGPDVGVDASRYLREMLDRLDQLEHRWVMEWRHPILGGGGYPVPIDRQGVAPFFINPGRIEAGDWAGSIPGHARIEGGVLYPGWLDGEEVKADFAAELEAYVSREPWLVANPPDIRIGEVYDVPPFETPVDHPGCQALAGALESATGEPAVFSGFKGVHDGCYVQEALGLDIVALGPGDLSFGAHGANEYVPIEQLLDCARAFALMAIRWCGLAS